MIGGESFQHEVDVAVPEHALARIEAAFVVLAVPPRPAVPGVGPFDDLPRPARNRRERGLCKQLLTWFLLIDHERDSTETRDCGSNPS